MPEFKPCVGCGYCCGVQCSSSVIKYGVQDLCPALYWNGKKYRCRDVKEVKRFVAIGGGCPSTLFNTWRDDVKERY